MSPADDDSSVRGRPPKLKPEAQELWELGLSVSLANRIALAGITTWEQLASATYGELRTLPPVGEATAIKVLELVKLLKERT